MTKCRNGRMRKVDCGREDQRFPPMENKLPRKLPSLTNSMKGLFFQHWRISSKGLWTQRGKKQMHPLTVWRQFPGCSQREKPKQMPATSLSWGESDVNPERQRELHLQDTLLPPQKKGGVLYRELQRSAENLLNFWLGSHLHTGNNTKKESTKQL